MREKLAAKSKSIRRIIKQHKMKICKPLNPYWVAGFCAGEMSFSLHRQAAAKTSTEVNNKHNKRIRICFSLAQHAREESLIRRLRDFFNCGLVCFDTKPRKIVYFRVNSLQDCLQLCAFFSKYHLHNSRQKELMTICQLCSQVSKLSQLNKTAWALSDMNINENKCQAMVEQKPPELDPHWIVGCSDAEGCFYVTLTPNKTSKLGYRVITSFSISQSIDDSHILKGIAKFFHCGSITKARIKNSRKLMQEFRVVGIADCVNKIIPFFESYGPLLTQKQKDFELFRDVVYICAKKEHLTESGLERIMNLRKMHAASTEQDSKDESAFSLREEGLSKGKGFLA